MEDKQMEDRRIEDEWIKDKEKDAAITAKDLAWW